MPVRPSDEPATNGNQEMKPSNRREYLVDFINAQSAAEQTSQTRKKSLTIPHQSFEFLDLSSPSENSPQDSTVTSQGSKSSVSNVTELNPSQKIASAVEAKRAKLRPSLLPVEGKIEGAKAMEFGCTKYAKDDWRTNPQVTREGLIDAIERHLQALQMGETHAPDSGVHHLGHIIAGAAMLLSRFEGK